MTEEPDIKQTMKHIPSLSDVNTFFGRILVKLGLRPAPNLPVLVQDGEGHWSSRFTCAGIRFKLDVRHMNVPVPPPDMPFEDCARMWKQGDAPGCGRKEYLRAIITVMLDQACQRAVMVDISATDEAGVKTRVRDIAQALEIMRKEVAWLVRRKALVEKAAKDMRAPIVMLDNSESPLHHWAEFKASRDRAEPPWRDLV